MDNQFWIVVFAFVLALGMAIRPTFFIPNPKHRTWRLERGIRYIGMAAGIMFAIWIIHTLLRS